jgi:hypothetical protein
MRRSDAAAARHHQEYQARNLKPQLVKDATQSPRRGKDRLLRRTDDPAALSLLRGYSRHHSQLPCGRNLVHGLDFNSLRRYNNANLCPRETVRRLQASNCWSGFGTSRRRRGTYVDQQLKQLMKELGEAINESLSDSEQIAEVVSRIKEGGYDIFLVLEATIGVSKQGEKTSDKTSLVTTLSTNPEFKINDQDLKFLKSLRIKIEEEKEK